MKILSGYQSFWQRAKTSFQCKISELPPNSYCARNIMFISKIMEVESCVNIGTAAYMPSHDEIPPLS